MSPSMLNSQLAMLWHHFTNHLVGLNVNIPVNMTEYFRLTDFWAALQIKDEIRNTVNTVMLDMRFSQWWLGSACCLAHTLTLKRLHIPLKHQWTSTDHMKSHPTRQYCFKMYLNGRIHNSTSNRECHTERLEPQHILKHQWTINLEEWEKEQADSHHSLVGYEAVYFLFVAYF